MLRLLRKKKVAKRIFYVLAAIIIPAFVIWGSASVINKSKVPDYAGVIFGKKVSFDEFQDALAGWRMQMKLQYGDKANEITGAFFNPAQAAWDRLIILHEARARRISVKDSDIVAMITNLPFLQRDGRFDPQTYDLFLKYSLNEQARIFEEKLRQNIAMSKVFEEVTNKINISDDETRKEYEKQNIQTRVEYVFFPSLGYKSKIAISDDEVKAYYETHKDKFRVPPQINSAYVAIELKNEATEAQKAEAAEKIKKVAVAAKTKELAEAAKVEGLEIKETGLFSLEDPIPGFGWIPELSTLLFDLPKDATSKVVELSRGVYLFKIKEKKDTYLADFNEAKEKAKDGLLSERSKDMAAKNAADFVNAIKTKPSDFKQAAAKEALEVKETPLFSHEGYIPELGLAQPLKDAAFALSKDEVAAVPIELQQGFYAIKSIETIPIDEEKYKKEKEEFSKQLLENKRNKAFNDFFEELKKKARLVNYIQDSMVEKYR
jgi:peptidyl-prolyl cis-trans isomerase D